MGDELGSNGKPYSDYTFYRAVNTRDKIADPDCWQPIEFTLLPDSAAIRTMAPIIRPRTLQAGLRLLDGANLAHDVE